MRLKEKWKKSDNYLGRCFIGCHSYKSKNTLIIDIFLDAINYVCYEKDKYKADVNIFRVAFQYFQVLKRKFYTKISFFFKY